MKKQYFYYDDEKRIKIPRASTKQEGDDHIHDHDKAKVSASSSNMTWLRLKDPRIVKVSRTCGGKDRHSKVCTVRGLRDRRVRLSVPTALQLYDLQERLGFTQPSKVIDWLLEAAKHDINGLPPLPPLNLSLIHHHAIVSSNSHPTDQHQWEASNSFWKLTDPKEAAAPDSSSRRQHHNHPVVIDDEDGDEDDPEDQVVKEGSHVHKVLQHHHPNVSSSFGGFLNSSVPLGYQWDPNAASATTHDDVSSNNVVAFSSPLSLSMSTDNQSHFASQFAPNVELDDDVVRTQMNHYHMLASTSTPSLYTSMMILNTTTPTLGCPSK